MAHMTGFLSKKLIEYPEENGGNDQLSTHKDGKTDRKNFLDITALVRSVQRSEGNFDCFGKSRGLCSRLDCAWYSYCIQYADSFDK
ncbi:MAG TPA: hypothetical protein PKV75_00615 [Desulfobacterales bacterium]|nr:hypothetical protein [Desulfobacterales bacterium]